MTCLGVIHRVGNKLHSILGRFKMDLGWIINAYSNNYIHTKGGGGYST